MTQGGRGSDWLARIVGMLDHVSAAHCDNCTQTRNFTSTQHSTHWDNLALFHCCNILSSGSWCFVSPVSCPPLAFRRRIRRYHGLVSLAELPLATWSRSLEICGSRQPTKCSSDFIPVFLLDRQSIRVLYSNFIRLKCWRRQWVQRFACTHSIFSV